MQTTDPPTPPADHPPGAPWPLDAAAVYLQVSRRHLTRLTDLGRIRTVRLGRRVFIPDDEVQRVAREGC